MKTLTNASQVKLLDTYRLNFLPEVKKWAMGIFDQKYKSPEWDTYFIMRDAMFDKLMMINKKLCDLQGIEPQDMWEHPKYIQ